MSFIDLHSTMNEVWRGNFTEAAEIAKDAMERADQLGGDHALSSPMPSERFVAAYAGREPEARHTLALPRRRSQPLRLYSAGRSGNHEPGVSRRFMGNNADADNLAATGGTLQRAAQHGNRYRSVPADAIEAMIALGRRGDAEPLIEALEYHGRRLDRAWMLAHRRVAEA